jgi:hypothetical protein
VVGLDETEKFLIQAYWIMGRSMNSRNRLFDYDYTTGRLYTKAVDESKVKDPDLIIYDAMLRDHGTFAVSNGHQTRAVVESHCDWGVFHTLNQWTYEPDAPNFTPRVSAWCSVETKRPIVHMSVLRKSLWSELCDHCFWSLPLGRGFGYCVTTYSGNGDPLPSFRGDPYLLPLRGSISQVIREFWTMYLNPENLVSLAVKFIGRESGVSTIEIKNKYG